jgi:hypothetical protein
MFDGQYEDTIVVTFIDDDVAPMFVSPDFWPQTNVKPAHLGLGGNEGERVLDGLKVPGGLQQPEGLQGVVEDDVEISGCL